MMATSASSVCRFSQRGLSRKVGLPIGTGTIRGSLVTLEVSLLPIMAIGHRPVAGCHRGGNRADRSAGRQDWALGVPALVARYLWPERVWHVLSGYRWLGKPDDHIAARFSFSTMQTFAPVKSRLI